MKKVRIKVTATVETYVFIEDGDDESMLLQRNVDIYLHGKGVHGHWTKTDLGSNESKVEIIPSKTI